MKSKKIALFLLLSINLLSFSQDKVIELPLTIQNGFSPFHMNLMVMWPNPEDENFPLKNTSLKVSKFPEGLIDMKYGNIISNNYQFIYQNYLLGNIPEDWYISSNTYKIWEIVDTLSLSKNPVETRIVFAYGSDSEGNLKIVVDANGNLDLSDDRLIKPLESNYLNNSLNPDSLIIANTFNVPLEIFIQNKIVPVSVPMFVMYSNRQNMFYYGLSICATTQYKGKQIAVSPSGTDFLVYHQNQRGIQLAFINNLQNGELIKEKDIYRNNDYIEIRDEIYKVIGVNIKKFTLVLEKTGLTKEQFFSPQVGYYAHPFQEEEIISKLTISLERLKGRYVLLDFWAEWCGPCIQEFPHLKELYSKTDRIKFEIIGIAGSSSLNGIKRLIDQHEISWPQILSDTTNMITEKYHIQYYPTTFLIDKEGIIIAKDLRGKELEETILRLITE